MRAKPPRFMRRRDVRIELNNMSRHTLATIEKSDPTFPRFFALTPGFEVIERRAFERWLRLKKLCARQE